MIILNFITFLFYCNGSSELVIVFDDNVKPLEHELEKDDVSIFL